MKPDKRKRMRNTKRQTSGWYSTPQDKFRVPAYKQLWPVPVKS